ncbi:hypothetical protein OHS33_10475 [Streptomyces sp. NBC_00536]|uniref:hypothetical protein n=1 Tax=Streptomyces sp. NBC_00536 TaxID=2975769 RepID=UPI002E80871B|nr:hypothetical protein [Streptomyces sp. NBC_00536]WUC78728.1 hypothetical protein OHS33_10475 [Streptomyces sp. NBC_00536]
MNIRMPGRVEHGGHRLARTAALLVALVLPAAAGVLGGAAVAHAAPVGNSSFTWNGDPGDGRGDDQARSYDSMSGDVFGATAAADHGSVSVSINRPGDPWTAALAAPAGQELAVGAYPDAVRFPETGERPAAPGLFVNGYRGGCATLTGGFTITKLEWGPGRTVKSLIADYSQDCDDRNVLSGHLEITPTPVPAALTLGLTIAADGKATAPTARATVHGTLTCSKPVTAYISGTAVQQLKHTTTNGIVGAVEVVCTPGKPAPWTAAAWSLADTPAPFAKGTATIDLTARAYDPDGARVTTATKSRLVTLRTP